jgi:hypothetical protein
VAGLLSSPYRGLVAKRAHAACVATSARWGHPLYATGQRSAPKCQVHPGAHRLAPGHLYPSVPNNRGCSTLSPLRSPPRLLCSCLPKQAHTHQPRICSLPEGSPRVATRGGPCWERVGPKALRQRDTRETRAVPEPPLEAASRCVVACTTEVAPRLELDAQSRFSIHCWSTVPAVLVLERPTSRPCSADESVVPRRCFQRRDTLSFHGFLFPLQGPLSVVPLTSPAPKSPDSRHLSAWSRLRCPRHPSRGWFFMLASQPGGPAGVCPTWELRCRSSPATRE